MQLEAYAVSSVIFGIVEGFVQVDESILGCVFLFNAINSYAAGNRHDGFCRLVCNELPYFFCKGPESFGIKIIADADKFFSAPSANLYVVLFNFR